MQGAILARLFAPLALIGLAVGSLPAMAAERVINLRDVAIPVTGDAVLDGLIADAGQKSVTVQTPQHPGWRAKAPAIDRLCLGGAGTCPGFAYLLVEAPFATVADQVDSVVRKGGGATVTDLSAPLKDAHPAVQALLLTRRPDLLQDVWDRHRADLVRQRAWLPAEIEQMMRDASEKGPLPEDSPVLDQEPLLQRPHAVRRITVVEPGKKKFMNPVTGTLTLEIGLHDLAPVFDRPLTLVEISREDYWEREVAFHIPIAGKGPRDTEFRDLFVPEAPTTEIMRRLREQGIRFSLLPGGRLWWESLAFLRSPRPASSPPVAVIDPPAIAIAAEPPPVLDASVVPVAQWQGMPGIEIAEWQALLPLKDGRLAAFVLDFDMTAYTLRSSLLIFDPARREVRMAWQGNQLNDAFLSPDGRVLWWQEVRSGGRDPTSLVRLELGGGEPVSAPLPEIMLPRWMLDRRAAPLLVSSGRLEPVAWTAAPDARLGPAIVSQRRTNWLPVRMEPGAELWMGDSNLYAVDSRDGAVVRGIVLPIGATAPAWRTRTAFLGSAAQGWIALPHDGGLRIASLRDLRLTAAATWEGMDLPHTNLARSANGRLLAHKRHLWPMPSARPAYTLAGEAVLYAFSWDGRTLWGVGQG
ncbi:MAG: hypothetical protein ACM3Q1_02205, partial [Bacteroidales bacterium]